MSKLKLNTASDLEKFLYILAEESVKKSKSTIKEDTEQSAFMNALKNDKKLYSQGLHEQEEDEEPVVGLDMGKIRTARVARTKTAAAKEAEEREADNNQGECSSEVERYKSEFIKSNLISKN